MRSVAEWLVALGVIGGVIWLGLPLVRNLAPPPAGTVTLVESTLPALPSGVPAGAESVPFLILDSGVVIQRGMPEAEVRSRPLSRLTAGAAESETGVIGERAILPFRSGASRFWVVLDRTEPGREREITAIYVR